MSTIFVSKANQFLGFLKRNLYNAPIQIKEHSYKQYTLNIVHLSGTLITYVTAIQKLEMIKHCAARFVYGIGQIINKTV